MFKQEDTWKAKFDAASGRGKAGIGEENQPGQGEQAQKQAPGTTEG